LSAVSPPAAKDRGRNKRPRAFSRYSRHALRAIVGIPTPASSTARGSAG
jgi:hypothetical protein